jgi:transposase
MWATSLKEKRTVSAGHPPISSAAQFQSDIASYSLSGLPISRHESHTALVFAAGVIIIDNASIHWGSATDTLQHDLIKLVSDRGGIVIFTPPDCPDSNAIEWVFGEMVSPYCIYSTLFAVSQ